MRLTVAALLVCSIAHAATAPTIVTTASTFAVRGQPYHYGDNDQAIATGDAPIVWSATTAPPGFAINSSTGVITWTPAAGGDVPCTIVATNGAGMSAQSFTVHVAAPPTITSTPTTSATVGVAYRYGSDGAMHASGDGPISFKVASAPPGLVVDATTGAVTFTPSTAGSFAVTLEADNAYGAAQQSFTLGVAAGAGTPPTLLRDANPSAAVGVPYAYDPKRALSLVGGDTPVTFAKIAGPSDLYVDARSGAVAWIPSSAGTQTVTVRAANLVGSDDYTFVVNVAAGVTAQPVAVAAVAPPSGPAPLAVAFSSAGSTPGGDAALFDTAWDFGDGSPPAHDAAPAHTYQAARQYRATLTVTNSYGSSASAVVTVAATAGGLLPPSAHATADSTDGTDLLAVQFRCDCTAGSAPIVATLWDFGDGSQSSASNPKHTFLPGRWRVHLTVSDKNGLSSEDAITITVTAGTRLPPLARAYATPPSGAPPLQVTLLATAIDLTGPITDLSWDFGDGTQGSAVDHVQKTYTDPGTYRVTLRVTGTSGLIATDEVVITVSSAGGTAPEILSLPTKVAYVGVAYKYGSTGLPQARGSQPLTWSLGAVAPAGLQVHKDTGELLWKPTANEVGTQHLMLVVTNGAGSNLQAFDVEVRPASEAPKGGCAIGGRSDGAGALIVLLALTSVVGRSMRRKRQRENVR